METNDEFAIRFGKWLSDYCDTSGIVDLWFYYQQNKGETQKMKTEELLKIFKEQEEQK